MSKQTILKLSLVILLGIIGFSLISLNAQVAVKKEKDKLSQKVDEIKGEVKKITVETDEGVTVFEGEDAEKLMKRMKSKKINAYAFINEDGDVDVKLDEMVILDAEDFDTEFDFDVMIMSGGEGEWTIKGDSTENIKEKLEVKREDGELKVTVTTIENGNESVKTYTGEEAEEYLESRKEGD